MFFFFFPFLCGPVPTTPVSNGTDSEVYATASKYPPRPTAVRFHIHSQLSTSNTCFFPRSSAVSSSSPSAQMSAKLRLFSPFSSEWVIRIVAAIQVQPILFPPRLCVNPRAHFSPDFSPFFSESAVDRHDASYDVLLLPR